MSFRRRITLVAAAAVAIAVVLASALTYLLVSHQLRGQIDAQLRTRSEGLRLIAGNAPAGPQASLSSRDERYLKQVLANQGRHGRLRADGKSAANLSTLLAPPANVGGSTTGGRGSSSTNRALARNPFGSLPPHPDEVRGYQQLINSSGKILFRSSTNVTLPVGGAARTLAGKGGRPFFSDARVNGIEVRVLTEAVRPGYAVQFAEPLTEVDHLLG